MQSFLFFYMMKEDNAKAWFWIAPAYFIQGLPNAVCAGMAIVFYTSMGLGIGAASAITSLIYLPWCLKGIWSPIIDLYSTKRKWVLSSILAMSLIFLLIALSCFLEWYVVISAILFWILSFVSATYDISIDGYYLLALNDRRQAFFVGIRSSFFRLAILFAQGGLIMCTGLIIKYIVDNKAVAWSASFIICAVLIAIFWLLLKYVLPFPKNDVVVDCNNKSISSKNFFRVYAEFFTQTNIVSILIFVLLYRFAEAQLVKVAQPFLLADMQTGGLAMPLEHVGLIYGTFGTLCLFAGGIIGGILIAKYGLLKLLPIMALFINIPNIVYLIMSYEVPSSLMDICLFISCEQFGYGFGFAGYMTFMMFAVSGKNKTSQYAMLSAFMAIGYMIPGYFAGYIQEYLGFKDFFVWIMISTLVSFASVYPALKVLKARRLNSSLR